MATKANTNIPEPVITEATELLTNALALLKPHLIALSPNERQSLPKMSDKTQPFVEKVLAYCDASPQFVPAFMNTRALDNDYRQYNELLPLLRLVRQLHSGIDDTTMQISAACFTNALNYYNSAKQGSRSDVPGAKTIFEDLRKRFVRNRSSDDSALNDQTEIL